MKNSSTNKTRKIDLQDEAEKVLQTVANLGDHEIINENLFVSQVISFFSNCYDFLYIKKNGKKQFSTASFFEEKENLEFLKNEAVKRLFEYEKLTRTPILRKMIVDVLVNTFVKLNKKRE